MDSHRTHISRKHNGLTSDSRWTLTWFTSNSHRTQIEPTSDSPRTHIGLTTDSHRTHTRLTPHSYRTLLGRTSDEHRTHIGPTRQSAGSGLWNRAQHSTQGTVRRIWRGNGAQDLAGERCAGSESSFFKDLKEIRSQILRTVPPRGEAEENLRLQHPCVGISTPRPHAASPRLARPHARTNETKRLPG